MSIIPDRAAFFEVVKAGPFNGSLEASQTDGMNALLDCWDRKPELQDPRWLAYMLATMAFETKGSMRPVSDPGKGYGHAYGVPDPDTGQAYYGRGYVPLRWKFNYSSWGKTLGKDLLGNPDLVLQPDVASILLTEGLKHGLFTGYPLGDYINETVDDPVRARLSAGDMANAEEVAALHGSFLSAINAVR